MLFLHLYVNVGWNYHSSFIGSHSRFYKWDFDSIYDPYHEIDTYAKQKQL